MEKVCIVIPGAMVVVAVEETLLLLEDSRLTKVVSTLRDFCGFKIPLGCFFFLKTDGGSLEVFPGPPFFLSSFSLMCSGLRSLGERRSPASL